MKRICKAFLSHAWHAFTAHFWRFWRFEALKSDFFSVSRGSAGSVSRLGFSYSWKRGRFLSNFQQHYYIQAFFVICTPLKKLSPKNSDKKPPENWAEKLRSLEVSPKKAHITKKWKLRRKSSGQVSGGRDYVQGPAKKILYHIVMFHGWVPCASPIQCYHLFVMRNIKLDFVTVVVKWHDRICVLVLLSGTNNFLGNQTLPQAGCLPTTLPIPFFCGEFHSFTF